MYLSNIHWFIDSLIEVARWLGRATMIQRHREEDKQFTIELFITALSIP